MPPVRCQYCDQVSEIASITSWPTPRCPNCARPFTVAPGAAAAGYLHTGGGTPIQDADRIAAELSGPNAYQAPGMLRGADRMLFQRFRYRPLASRSMVTSTLLAVMISLAIGALSILIRRQGALNRIASGDFGGEIDRNTLNSVLGIIAVGFAAVTVPLGLMFTIWLRRAYINLPALGNVPLRRNPNTTFWCWIVPIWNLWVPKEIVNDVWRGSEPGAPVGDSQWTKRKVPWLVQIWWGTFLATQWPVNAFVVAWWMRGDLRIPTKDQNWLTAEQVRDFNPALVFAVACLLVSAITALMILVRVTANQEGRAREMGQVDSTGRTL